VDVLPTTGFDKLVQDLLEDLDDDADTAEDVGEEAVDKSDRSGPPRKIRVFFGAKTLFSLEDLFDYSVDNGWDEFWFIGMQKMAEELDFLDLRAQSTSKAGQAYSRSTGSAQNPVEVDR